MDLLELSKQFLLRVEAESGKPVILQSDSSIAGHAMIKVAASNQAAHVLLYKPEQESVLPYLVAYQCEFALRTILAEPGTQFDLVAKPDMLAEVQELMRRHHEGRNEIPASALPQLAKRFGDELGFQLRSMPVTLRIDMLLHEAHPELMELQRESLDRQLQENMGALSPRAKELAPIEIIRPNALMNSAFAKFYTGLWNAPMIVAPYIEASGKGVS